MAKASAPPTSVVVLAGGQSSRLGRDKSLLNVCGQPLVARIINTLSTLSDDLVVVASDLEPLDALDLPARLVRDEKQSVGALMGLYTGLKVVDHTHALVVACDMPFLNLSLLRYMLPLASGYDIVIPRMNDYLEPLHAVYGKSCLPAIQRLLDQGRRQIIAFFPEVRVRYIEEAEINRFDPQHLSFLNVNTPEDWQEVQRLLGDL